MEKLPDHQKGLLITGIGGLLLTIDIPLLRLGNGESWSIILLRASCTVAVMLVVWGMLKLAGRNPPPLIAGRAGLVVACLYAVSGVTFMLAVFRTPTANLVFILALNPMLAALLGRIFLGEKLRPSTLAAMVAMAGGVWLIVSDGMSGGSLTGNLLAMAAATALAGAITVSRASGKDMGLTAVTSAGFLIVIAGFMVAQNGYRVDDPVWIVIDGAIVMTIAFFCLATGPRWLTGPEVAMFYMLETVLAPVWVWLIFAEIPTRNTFIGGAIVLSALVAHTAWQLHTHAQARRRALSTPRHPV